MLSRRRCCCGGGGSTCHAGFQTTGCPDGSALRNCTVEVTSDVHDGTCLTTDTDPSICYDDLTVDGPGTYTVTVSKSGYVTFSATMDLTCSDTPHQIALQPVGETTGIATFSVKGCCNANLPGATVTLTGPGGDVQGGQTNASGQITFPVTTTGTHTWSISKDRFVSQSGSFTSFFDCGSDGPWNISRTLVPASGYACGPLRFNQSVVPDPISTSLSLTDSAYGGCSLTYDSTNKYWIGTVSGSFPGDSCGCPAAGFTLQYVLYGCDNGQATYVLVINYSYCAMVFCGFGTTQDGCPSDDTGLDCADHLSESIETNCFPVPGGPDPANYAASFTTVASVYSWSLTAPPSWEFSGSITATNPSCTTGTVKGWPSGSSITISE